MFPRAGYLAGLRQLCDEHGRALDPGRGPDRNGPYGRVVRVPTRGDRARRPDLCQGPGRRNRRRRDDGQARRSPRCSKPGMHASTFGGNPIACRAALAAIETIEADGLLERGLAIGERFREQFEALRAELPTLVRDIRIKGTMIGLDLTFDATDIVAELHEAAAFDQRHPRPRRSGCCRP